MELNLDLEGSISFRENNAIKGFEQVHAKFVIDFQIDSEGTIHPHSVNKSFTSLVHILNESTDEETPTNKEFKISKVTLKGYMRNSLVPESFSFDDETGTLSLVYFQP